MSYTLTFDASAKIKTGSAHAANWARHIFRDVDEARGVHVHHTNENIVPERTHLNTSMIRDMDSGEWVAALSSQEILDALDDRLSTLNKSPRSDAVVMRPLVLQMGADWYAENNPDWRENGLNEKSLKLHQDMTEFAEQFTTEHGDIRNLFAVSTHLDETNPQLQFAFTPVTDDGRLAQKDWFKSPTQLRQLHQEFRQFMIDRGYDIEREPTKRSKEHLDSNEFARMADRVRDGVAEVETRSQELETRSAQLDKQDEQIKEREYKLENDEAELEEKLDDVLSRERALLDREQAAKTALERARAMQLEAQRLRDEAEADKLAEAEARANAEKLERLARQARGSAESSRDLAESMTKKALSAYEQLANVQAAGGFPAAFQQQRVRDMTGRECSIGDLYASFLQMNKPQPQPRKPFPWEVQTPANTTQQQQGRSYGA